MVDISADEQARDFMRQTSGKSVIPQIFVDGQYKGDFEAFSEANEEGTVEAFLGLS